MSIVDWLERYKDALIKSKVIKKYSERYLIANMYLSQHGYCVHIEVTSLL